MSNMLNENEGKQRSMVKASKTTISNGYEYSCREYGAYSSVIQSRNSNTSLSSFDAPSDEERHEREMRRSLRDRPCAHRALPAHHTLSMISRERIPKNQYDRPVAIAKKSSTNLVGSRSSFNGVNVDTQRIKKSGPSRKYCDHARAPYTYTDVHSTSDPAQTLNMKRMERNLDALSIDHLSRGKKDSEGSNLGMNVFSMKMKVKNFQFNARMLLASVACILFLSISTDISKTVHQTRSTAQRKKSNVSYGVEHGREIAFPLDAKIRGTNTLNAKKNYDIHQESISNMLLNGSGRPVVDAPKFVPENMQSGTSNERRKHKPIVAYAKTTANNPAPKFVPEKFILEENDVLDKTHEIKAGNYAVGVAAGLSFTVIVTLVLLGSVVRRGQIPNSQSRRALTV